MEGVWLGRGRTHVGHTSGNRGEHTGRVMHCNIEICDMGVTSFVKEDIVRFQVTVGCGVGVRRECGEEKSYR